MYGFAAGALSMGIDKLSATDKKRFANMLTRVNSNNAKGIIVSQKYTYRESFDIGHSGGYWILTGKPTYKTY